MKKYLFAALALTALVACSKDPIDDVLTSSKKSVFISIANMASDTRAATTGGTTTGNGANVACANAGDLKFLFADKTGKILATKEWNPNAVQNQNTAGSTNEGVGNDPNTAQIAFHMLPEQVTQVAVIANYEDWEDLTTLEEAEAAWKTEDNVIASEINKIVAYGSSTLTRKPAPNDFIEIDDHNYPAMTATVTINPYMSRIEIGHIGCTNLGTLYSKIGLLGLSLAGGEFTESHAGVNNKPYTISLGTSFTSDSDWTTNAAYVLSSKHLTTPNHDDNVVAPEDSKVWSWNILPQAISDLTLNMHVVGNGYTVQVPEKSVTISTYNGNLSPILSFAQGNIYKFNIDFAENNIDNVDILSVDVTVSIAKWVVNEVTPGFATN